MVHRRRGGEVLAGLVALAVALGELGEAEMAVGDEGAHAARLGKGNLQRVRRGPDVHPTPFQYVVPGQVPDLTTTSTEFTLKMKM